MYKGREVAALSGLTVRALHHYDAIDLLQPPTRSDAGYRLYSSDEVRTPRRIRRYRGFGFSLDEIGELLAATASDRALTERMANTIAEDPDWSERLWAEQRLQQQKVGNAVGRRAPEALTAAGAPRERVAELLADAMRIFNEDALLWAGADNDDLLNALPQPV